MVNPFDSLAQNVFNIVANNMGYTVSWTPSLGGPLQTARVGYKDPTTVYKELGDVEYNPYNYGMEYKDGDLTGLKASVDNGNNETVIITFSENPLSQSSYNVRQIKAIHDGKCYLAILELLSE